MLSSTSLMIATVAIATTMMGCSGTVPPATAPVVASDPARVVPVYIIPNCQVLAGKRYCMWLEPKLLHPEASTPTNTGNIPSGIAL